MRLLVGVASCSLPGTVEWITAVLHDFRAERSEVVGDEVIAWMLLKAAWELAVIAGTGSNTIGRSLTAAASARAAGARIWATRASGYWIGLHSVRRALRAYDRDEPTEILKKVGEIWGTQTLEDP